MYSFLHDFIEYRDNGSILSELGNESSCFGSNANWDTGDEPEVQITRKATDANESKYEEKKDEDFEPKSSITSENKAPSNAEEFIIPDQTLPVILDSK